MKTGINLLLWTTHVTDVHLPVVESIKAAGYTGAEIPIHQTDVAHYTALGKQIADLGLQRSASTALPGPEACLISGDPGCRSAGIDYLKRVIDCARELGSETLIGPVYQALGHFTGQGPADDEYKRASEGIRRVASHAEAAGVTICIEPLNRFECHLVNTVEAGVKLAAMVDSANVKVMYDAFHANIEESDPLAVIDRHAAHIAHVHISENHRGAPGDGHLPLRETVARFQANGFNGWFVVESFGTALPDLAAATRCWRKTFASEQHVIDQGIALLRSLSAV